MKHWYISYTYIDGFGNRQYNHVLRKDLHPLEWFKNSAPLGDVITFYSEISDIEHNTYYSK